MKPTLIDTEKYRSRILDSAILVGSVLGVISFVTSSIDADPRPFYAKPFDGFLVFVLVILAFRRKKISVKAKSLLLCLLLFLLAITDTFHYGLYSYNSMLLVLIPFICMLGFNSRITILAGVISFLAYLLLGYLYTQETLILKYDLSRYLSFNEWFQKGLLYTIIGTVFAVVINYFNKDIFRFISNLNSQNQKVQEREANLSAIIESTTNLIGLYDKELKLIEFNQAFAQTALMTDGIVLEKGMSVLSHIKNDYAVVFEKFLKKSLKGEKFERTIEYPLPDGSEIVLQLSYNPIRKDDEIVGVSMFVEDITPLKEAQRELKVYTEQLEGLVRERTKEIQSANEELKEGNIQLQETVSALKKTQNQLLQAEKMASLGLFAAGVGHEINNPLNYIENGIQIIEEKLSAVDEEVLKDVAPIFNMVHEGVGRTTKIVNSLSHFSRKSTDDDVFEPCDLNEILQNCMTILQFKTKNRIEIAHHFQAKKMIVKGIETRLHQAFLNICSNAIQAIEGKGKIQIRTIKKEEGTYVEIEDDGVGISQENLGKIGDHFFTTKPPGEGTGLGLSIAFAAFEQHGATVSVASDEGKGTTFSILFPAKN